MMLDTSKIKDKGWLNELPSQWKKIKLKYLATEAGTLFTDGDWIESDIIEDDGIRYLTTGNVGVLEFKNQGNGFISEETFRKLHCLEVVPGDLMISRLNEPIGRTCLVPNDYQRYVVAVDNVILRPDKKHNKLFLMYAMNSDGFSEYANIVARGTTMPRISKTQLGSLWLSLPPTKEQEKIGLILHEKTSAINTIINDLEKQVDILKKYKLSLINQKISKGLNNSIKLKDSGDERLGMIPQNWNITPIKYGVSINNQALTEYTRPDYMFKYIDIGAVSFQDGITEFEETTFEESPSRARRKVEQGDVIISTVRTYLKAIARIVDSENVIVSTGFAVLSPIKFDSVYLEYLCKSDIVCSEIERRSTGVAYPAINASEIGKISVYLPPQDEQKEIGEFLKNKCGDIDNVIKMKEKSIEHMKKYKISLIHEFITGKRKAKGV